MPADRHLHDAIADEMLRRLAHSTELSKIRHRVQVTSFGGSGTTALYDHLLAAGVDVPGTPGFFPFKHQREPPMSDCVPSGFKVVYLFGDPRNAVVSVFRRGFQGGHYRSMRLRRPAPDIEQRLVSLERFLEGGVDVFGLDDHFDRWFTSGTRTYPILYLRYEDLPKVWPEVRDFTGAPPGHPCLIVRPRASEWQTLPIPLRERIDEMYGALARRLASLPSVELR